MVTSPTPLKPFCLFLIVQIQSLRDDTQGLQVLAPSALWPHLHPTAHLCFLYSNSKNCAQPLNSPDHFKPSTFCLVPDNPTFRTGFKFTTSLCRHFFKTNHTHTPIFELTRKDNFKICNHLVKCGHPPIRTNAGPGAGAVSWSLLY